MRICPRFALVIVALTFTASSVTAQDFYKNTVTARSAGLGGVYVASSSDALDALAANPAGLTYLRGRILDLAVDTVFARGSFRNSVNNNSPLGTSPGAVPYAAFGMPIRHSRFSFGVGMMPELLSIGEWKYVDAPGTAGATYGLQRQKSEITAFRFAAGAGYAVSSKLSIGASLGAVYNTNTLQAPYIFQSQPALAGLKTLLDLHTTGVGWNTSVGVLVKPLRSVQVGAAWKSRSVIHSTGSASGDAYAQFAALGVNAPSHFTYSGAVRNVLPQSVLASAAWQANRHWLLAFQANWVDWSDSFVIMPVTLTNGTNATLNSLTGGNSLQDGVPLHWKDQYAFHIGAERGLTENTMLRFGYAHAHSPVPDSTLTPLTAAIFANQISSGLTIRRGRARYEATYTFHPAASQRVSQSALQAGEYDNSRVQVGTQSLTLNYSFAF